MASLSIAPSLEYHSSEDTEHTFKNKINSKGFCVTHPDIQVRVKKKVGKDVITPCPKCQAIHDLEVENRRKNEKLDRAIKRAAAEKESGNEIRLSDENVNPMIASAPAGVVNQSALKPARESFSSEWFACLEDPGVCCFVGIPCCFPIASIFYAHKIGISDTHGLCSLIFSILATACWPCGLIACHEKMLPCYATSLIKRSMEKHEVSNPPGPCYANGCCGFWLQALFCSHCTLCLLYREAKKFPVKK